MSRTRLLPSLSPFHGRRCEGGYVLGVVLVAMMIGLSLITALLGLSFTTQRAAITQQDLARERRAADGGLEVAVQEIRTNFSPGDPLCASLPSSVDMDLGGAAADKVSLKCADILDPTPASAGDVKVVGDDAEAFTHDGSKPLNLVGAVTVKKSAGFPGTAEPALQVSGNYVQGSACDLTSFKKKVSDADGGPECENTEARNLTADVSGETPPGATTSSIPAPPPAPCPDAANRSFNPGRFGAAQVASLNVLFAGCGGEFRFQPGYYWFDGTLVFKSPADPDLSRTVVLFGNSVVSTMTCQPGAATKVVLAATATITHESGRVLLCGDLVQVSEVDSGPQLVNATSTRFDVPANALAKSPPAVAEMSSPSNQLEATIVANGTRELDDFVLRWSSQEVPPSDFLASRGVWAEFFRPGVPTAVCKTNTGAPSFHRGRTLYETGVASQLDLLGGDCGTKLGGLLESDLNGWKLKVSFSQQFPTIGGLPVVLNYCNNTHSCKLYVSNLHLDNQAHEVKASLGESSGSSPWNNVSGLLEPGGGASYVVNNCSIQHDGLPWNNFCTRTGDETPSSFTISGFSLPDGLSDSDKLTSTVVAFDVAEANDLMANPTNTAAAAIQGSTTATISYSDSDGDPVTCTVTMSTYLRSRRTYTMDLTTCPGLSTGGQLQQASLVVSIQPEKGAWYTTINPNDEDEFVGNAGLELPTFDYVRLIATTNTVKDTVNMSVKIDEVNESSFRVYGTTNLPRANLLVDWAGTATAEALFNGQLTVRAVGSTQAPTATEVGVLCCGPMSPTIRVNAFTDTPPVEGDPGSGVIRGTARIRLDPGPGGSEVTVTDWQLCHLDGCELTDTVITP